MPEPTSRRTFLAASAATAALAAARAADPPPATVVVWDERQPEQKEAYPNFLGNWVADHLRTRPGLTVRSVGLDDDEKGLSPAVLRGADVLVWWGHKRQAEVTPAMAKPIVDRIAAGTLGLLALHSAHWATPFVEAMNERTRRDAEQAFTGAGRKVEVAYAAPPRRYTLPKPTDRVTPYTDLRKFPDGSERATVHLPFCCFPAYRADGKEPSKNYSAVLASGLGWMV